MPHSLETLPLEILFTILAHAGAFDPRLLPKHPLFAAAATCRQLCSTVEELSRSLLKQHANIEPPKTPKRVAAFVCRTRWMKHVIKICFFCRKKSVRKAILDANLTCCKDCDRKYFPKMTMTDATKQHNLAKLDLFTPSVLHPDLPPLSAGQYYVMGGPCICISEPDVLARKAHIVSLLGPKASDEDFMAARVYRLRRLNAKMKAYLEVDPPNNTIEWKGEGSRWDHVEVAGMLECEWRDLGMDMDVKRMPMWAWNKAFWDECEEKGCGCERPTAERKARRRMKAIKMVFCGEVYDQDTVYWIENALNEGPDD